MLDLECIIKPLRLAWLKRIFGDNKGAWKNYLVHLLRDLGDLLLFCCNYDIKYFTNSSLFYSELLK